MESKLVNWIGGIASCSAILIFGGLILFVGMLSLNSLSLKDLVQPVILVPLTILGLYLTSLFYLYSVVENGSRTKRIVGWLQSCFFHVALYFSIFIYLKLTDENPEVIVIFTPELIISILSAIGYYLAYKTQNEKIT